MRWLRLMAASFLVVVVVVVPVAAQESRAFQLEGRVVWMTGTNMLLSFSDRPPVSVDLRRIDPGELRAVSQNDWVIVTGVILRSSRQVTAISIIRNPWYPAPPPE